MVSVPATMAMIWRSGPFMVGGTVGQVIQGVKRKG